ncbi:MAG TPA: aldehyde dehydrogenase family protein, partial [Solirubrobacteraceae bacterium]
VLRSKLLQRATHGRLRHDRLYIDGEWLEPSDGRLVDVVNPLTEGVIGRAALVGPSDMDWAVRAARTAFDAGPWASSTVHERAAVMTRPAQLITARADEFTHIITLDVGSPGGDRHHAAARLQAVPRLARRAGSGATHALDTTAIGAVINQAVGALAARGTLALVGVGTPEIPLDVQSVISGGRSIRGVIEGDAVPQQLLPQLFRLHA